MSELTRLQHWWAGLLVARLDEANRIAACRHDGVRICSVCALGIGWGLVVPAVQPE
jgi:hypothetical protein